MSKTWMPPRKILVATDLTPKSNRAVERAIALAAKWGARLYVVHVVEVGDETSATAVATASKQAAEALADLERQIKRNPTATGIDIEILSTLGNPAERILAKCDRLLINLLVMGAGEKRTIGQRLLGTNVDRVLRRSMDPVLCVHKPAVSPYRKVVIATDFSEPSNVAFDCGIALFPNTELTGRGDRKFR